VYTVRVRVKGLPPVEAVELKVRVQGLGSGFGVLVGVCGEIK